MGDRVVDVLAICTAALLAVAVAWPPPHLRRLRSGTLALVRLRRHR